MIPTVSYHILHYTSTTLIELIIQRYYRKSISNETEDEETTGIPHTMTETYFPELIANFYGNMISDIILYPLETIMHRLLVQGTRTIIDNTDAGKNCFHISVFYICKSF